MFRISAMLLIPIFAYAQKPAATVPAFTFFKFDKSQFTNKNLQQNRLLFFVFFDANCDHCQHAVRAVNDRYQDLKKTALYLISLDSQEAMKGFINKYGKNLSGKKNVTLLQDLKNEFISDFGPRKYPSMFLYSPEKKLMIYSDDEGTLPQFFKKINDWANSHKLP